MSVEDEGGADDVADAVGLSACLSAPAFLSSATARSPGRASLWSVFRSPGVGVRCSS